MFLKAKNSGGIVWILAMWCILASTGPVKCAPCDTVNTSNGVEEFGTNLYSELVDINRSNNIIFSPVSVYSALGMVGMGAEGETASQINKALALCSTNNQEQANIHHSILQKYQNNPFLKIANKLFIEESEEVQDEFAKLVTENFFTSIGVVNFKDSKAVETINNWVEEKTDHLIKDLVEEGSFDKYTKMVLINAIHFIGNWVIQFDENRTSDAEFTFIGGDVASVSMMNRKDKFKHAYIPELNAAALEMDYKDSDLSMLIILPQNIIDFQKKLQAKPLSTITDKLISKTVNVYLPRFTVEFETKLSEPLSRMGITRMFTRQAEFTKLLKSADELHVSKAIHKAFINVNEKGTEAAAATAFELTVRFGGFDSDKIEVFNVNKPFYYIIKDSKNLKLFEGSIVNKFKQ